MPVQDCRLQGRSRQAPRDGFTACPGPACLRPSQGVLLHAVLHEPYHRVGGAALQGAIDQFLCLHSVGLLPLWNQGRIAGRFAIIRPRVVQCVVQAATFLS